MNTRCILLIALLGVSIAAALPKGARSKGSLLNKRQTDEIQSEITEATTAQDAIDSETPVVVEEPKEDVNPSQDEPLETPADEQTEVQLDAEPSSAQPENNPVEPATNPVETDVPKEDSPNTEVQQPDEDEEQDEEDDTGNDGDLFGALFPVGRKVDGGSFNSFFPIIFGSGNGRSAGGAAGTTAIANSFNTARKGKATSKATANA